MNSIPFDRDLRHERVYVVYKHNFINLQKFTSQQKFTELKDHTSKFKSLLQALFYFEEVTESRLRYIRLDSENIRFIERKYSIY